MAPALAFRLLSRHSYHRADKSILDRSPGGLVLWIATLGGSPPRGGTGSLSSPPPPRTSMSRRPPPNLSPSAGAAARSQGMSSRNAASTGESSPVRQAADSPTVGTSPASSR